MAKGYQKNQERKGQVALLGKALMRRSGKQCELCGAQGVSMAVTEIDPVPQVPDEDHAILICGECRDLMGNSGADPNRFRFLESVIWSDIPVVQAAAVRLCRELARRQVDWASDLLDSVYLNPGTEEFLD